MNMNIPQAVSSTTNLLDINLSNFNFKVSFPESPNENGHISVSYELPYPILMTSVYLHTNQLEKARALFKFEDCDGYFELPNNDKNFNKAISIQECFLEKEWKISAIAFLQKIRLSFLVKVNDLSETEVIRLFQQNFQNICIQGFHLNSSPNASSVIPLLNISELFSKNLKTEEAMETNILLGLALINARRFLQAAEVLRKAAAFFQKKTSKGLKAAKIQLLVAEAIKQPSMINDKMQAYYKATELFMGRQNMSNLQISNNFDIYSALLRISSNLCKFLLKILFEKVDPLKIAAIRGLEFLLEYMGCTIANLLSNILKAILMTYPLQNSELLLIEKGGNDPLIPLGSPINTQLAKHFSANNLEVGPENQQTQKLLVDIYNHLLESFLNVLTSASSYLLRNLFIEIITPNIFLSEMNNDLRTYVFRIAEKIISICQGDLEINLTFIASLIQYLDHKMSHSPLKIAGQKLWETLKSKAVVNLRGPEAKKVGDWIYENLCILQENKEIVQSSIEYFLDIMRSLCFREKKLQDVLIFTNKMPSNLFLNSNNSVNFEGFAQIISLFIEDLLLKNQPGAFEPISIYWNCLLDVFTCLESTNQILSHFSFDLLAKILKILREKSPNLAILNTILLIFKTMDDNRQEINEDFIKEFLFVFCDCIPHSVYDESFIVFEILLRKIPHFIDKFLLQKTIDALIDQFTVKSKAQKQAKNVLITHIKEENSLEIYSLALNYCFFENFEPLIDPEFTNSNSFEETQSSLGITIKFSNLSQSLNRKNMNNGISDSKVLNKLHELFLEKLNFAEKLFSDISENHLNYILSLLKTPSPLQSPLHKLLISGNSKVRLKGMKIIKIIFERFLKRKNAMNPKTKNNNKRNQNFFDYNSFLLSKFILLSLKICWESSLDPKLHFNGLLILDEVFQTILAGPDLKYDLERIIQKKSHDSPHPNYVIIDIFNYEFSEDLALSFEDDRYLHLRLFQILRLLPSLQSLTNSPWSNIRSLAYGIFCYWVKTDVTFYKPSLMKSLITPIFSLLLNLLNSKESECRTGGLNILGSFCGLGFDFSNFQIKQIQYFFRRHENLISQAIWESVFELQNDWDTTNQAAASTLIQLCAPKDLILNLHKLKKEISVLEFTNNLKTQPLGNQGNQGNIGLVQKDFSYSNLNKTLECSRLNKNEEISQQGMLLDNDEEIFWIEQCSDEELKELVSMFRNEYKPPQSLWIERENYNIEDLETDYDKFIYEADEVGNFFYEENNGKIYQQDASSKENLEDIDNNMDDLGIIEIDDEEWNEYYSEELKTLKNHKTTKDRLLKAGKATTINNNNNNNQFFSEKSNLNNTQPIPKHKTPVLEEKKVDEKTALRPHNPLFRPLTPPIRNDSGDNKQEAIDSYKNNDDELLFVATKMKRPDSGKKMKNNGQLFERRDSTELYEIKLKPEKNGNSSSSSQKSGDSSKKDSPLLPVKKSANVNEGQVEEENMNDTGKLMKNDNEHKEKSKKCSQNLKNNRKSFDSEEILEKNSKYGSVSNKLLQKLLETLQLNPKIKTNPQKKAKENQILQKLIKKSGSPGKMMIDNLLDSLKKGSFNSKASENEKARSSSLGKKNKTKNSKKKGEIGTNPSKDKLNKPRNKVSGLKKRNKINKDQINSKENDTL